MNERTQARPRWVGEILVVLALVVVYDWLIDLVGSRIDAANARGAALLQAEKSLHIAWERSLDHLAASSHWLTVTLSSYYDLAHVSVTLAVLVAIYLKAPESYRAARNSLVLINVIAFAVFVALPTTPPRLLPGGGFIDVVAKSGTWGSWEQSSALAGHTNQYASIPSLHIGWALWVVLAVTPLTTRVAARRLAAAHLVMTSFVILATGNHYILDIAAGAVLALAGWRMTHPRVAIVTPRPEVLIVSASMGAGHDGVAYELQRRLRAAGRTAEVVDFLPLLPIGLGKVLKFVYGEQLKHAPRTYEWLYAQLDKPKALNRGALVVASFARPALMRLARGTGVVVATYPLAGRALGQLRRAGRLDIPAITYLTDPEVHELWLDKGTDFYLAAYGKSAELASARTGRPAWGCGPLLPPRLSDPVTEEERAAARAALDVAAERVALLVTGSWGVGDPAATARAVAAAGLKPVLLCGRNEALRAELADDPQITAVGWVNDVRPLYAAADVVVHNAGGLASVEAFAAGVPVVGHACLPGHGHRNAKIMAEFGIAEYAADDAELIDTLHRLAGTPEGRELAGRARTVFTDDPTEMVGRLATLDEARRLAPVTVRRRWSQASWATRAASVAAAVPLLLVGVSFGVSEATERGFGATAHMATADRSALYVALLVDGEQLRSARDADLLAALGLSVLVEPDVASRQPADVRGLRTRGVAVLAAAPTKLPRTPSRAAAAFAGASREVAAAAGTPAGPVICLHGLGLLALPEARASKTPFAVARYLLRPGHLPQLKGGRVAVLDLTGLDGTEISTFLAELRAAASQRGLTLRPLPTSWLA